MPTLQELRKRDEIKLNKKNEEKEIPNEEQPNEEQPKSKIAALRERDEVKRESPQKSLWKDLSNNLFSSEQSPFESGLSDALKATGQAVAAGGDFIYDFLRGLNAGETTQMQDGMLGPDMPPRINLERGYTKSTGYDVNSPDSTLPEKILKTGVQGFTGGLVFPGGAQAEALGSNLFFGGGYEGAKAAGLGELSSLGTGVGASVLPALLKVATNPKQSVVDLITMFGKGFKKNAPEIEAAAARQNIGMPATEILENPLLERVSKAAAKKKDVGIEWSNRIDNEFANVVKNTFRTDPLLRQSSREVSGKNISEVSQNTFNNANKKLNAQYEIAKKSDPTFTTKPEKLANVANQLEQALPPVSSETQSLHNQVNKIQNEIYETVNKHVFNPKTQLIEIVPVKQIKDLNLEQVINLRSALGDLTRSVEKATGTKTLQSRFRPALEESLLELKASNPKVYNQIKKLDEAKYILNEKIYGLKVMNTIRKASKNGVTGEAVFNLVKNPEEYRAMSKVMRGTPEGRQALQEFNLNKAEEIFKNTISEAQVGKFEQQELLGMLNDPMSASWLNEIMTPKMQQNVQDLALLSQQLESGSAKLKAMSKVSRFSQTDSAFQHFTNAASNVLKQSPLKTIGQIGSSLFPGFAARIFVDQKFQESLIKAARAAQNNNISAYKKFMEAAYRRMGTAANISSENIVQN